ncbi:MAG TPA: RDD family protein [Fluviicola sp.]|nr:RDD family protein [Fluviicola sp.]
MKTISFTTSQFVTIEYELASPAIRAVAAIIDLVFLLIYFLIVGYFFSLNALNFTENSFSVFSIFLIRLPWLLYSPVIEQLTNGRSLGKLIMGIRVVKSTGENAGLREFFTRWIFRVIDIWIGGFGFLAILVSSTNEKRQRIGDIMADTVVINTRFTNSYSINEIQAIKNKENHTVTYPNVTRFTDNDMLLLKNAILRYNRQKTEENKTMLLELSKKIADLLNLPEEPQNKYQFLQCVLQDYIVLTR